MTEEKKNRLIWGTMLLIGALGCASLRNNPVMGIGPFAVGLIEGLIYACILTAVRVSDWRMAAVIALVTPVFLWMQRFLDGYMIPVEILIGMTLIGGMRMLLGKKRAYVLNAVMVTIPAYAVMLLASAVAIWIVKEERFVRALIIAWNTDAYSGLSLLGAALVSTLNMRHMKKEAR